MRGVVAAAAAGLCCAAFAVGFDVKDCGGCAFVDGERTFGADAFAAVGSIVDDNFAAGYAYVAVGFDTGWIADILC